MNKTTKFLKKHEDFGIPYLYFVIMICTVFGYILRYAAPEAYSSMLLIPYNAIVKQEYWRFFTWIFTVPYEIGGSLWMMIILPINLYFYYSIGRRLEMYWGRLMYNLYVIGGFVLIDIFVILGGVLKYNLGLFNTGILSVDDVYAGVDIMRFVYMSIFLAFTVVGGDGIVYMYFIIPLKMKWLGYIDLIILLYYFIIGGLFTKLIVVASILNYFIYFFINKKRYIPSPSDLKRKRQFKSSYKPKSSKPKDIKYNSDGTIKFPGSSKIIPPGYGNPEGISVHKCAVCGRTEVGNPNLEFRFCSKCNGNYEYCSDHLYTHEHIQ